MKRYALILALVMALAAGFGCAKKTQDATGDVDDMSPEMRAAIQQITCCEEGSMKLSASL